MTAQNDGEIIYATDVPVYGRTVTTTTSTGYGSIAYGVAFVANPVVIFQLQVVSMVRWSQVIVDQATTSFAFRLLRDSAAFEGDVLIHWMAMGTRA